MESMLDNCIYNSASPCEEELQSLEDHLELVKHASDIEATSDVVFTQGMSKEEIFLN